MAKKRVAIVGYGGMGGWHERKMQSSDVVELAGIWDIKESRRNMALEKGIHVYSSYEDLLADPTVEIVTVAVPNDSHLPLSIQAMRAGKNVISEKPVAMNSGELAEMIACSKETGRVFSVHQNRRWDADFLMAKHLYESGELGDIFCIESRVHGSRGIPGDWRGKQEHGGGMILDWGVHLIDQILQMVRDRKLEKLYCRCDHVTNYEVDDGFKLDMYFEKELTVRIEVGTSNFISMNRWYILGTNGSARMRNWRDDCEIVSCKNWSEKDVVPVVTAAGLTKTMAPRDDKTITESKIALPKSDVHDYYRNFCRAIDGVEPQIVTHEQMMRVMKVMEACFLSDKLGLPVKVED